MADRVYRPLLRIARELDRQPQQLVTLFGWPSMVFDRRHNKVVRQVVCKSLFAEDAIWEACGGSMEFALPSGRAAAAVRRHRRRIEAVGFDYVPEGEELLERFADARRFAERVRLASAPKRKVTLPPLELEFISGKKAGSKLVLHAEDAEVVANGKITLTKSSPVGDSVTIEELPSSTAQMPNLDDVASAFGCQPAGRGDRTPLTMYRKGANDTSPVAFGEFLLAHPLTGLGQESLDQGVVVVSKVCQRSMQVKGVVVNKPARGTLRSVLAAWSCRTGDGGWTKISDEDQRAMESLEPLLDANVLSGGDQMSKSLVDSITWLHTLGDAVPGALPVIHSLKGTSVWMGGDVSIMAGLVASGQASLSRIRPILGHLSWSSHQLELEVKRGVWVRAHTATPEVAVRLCVAALPSADDVGALDRHRSHIWRAALRTAGLPVLADFPRSPLVDDALRTILAEHYRGKRLTAEIRDLSA